MFALLVIIAWAVCNMYISCDTESKLNDIRHEEKMEIERRKLKAIKNKKPRKRTRTVVKHVNGSVLLQETLDYDEEEDIL